MKVESNLEHIRNRLLKDFENDAVEISYNYNPENRHLFWAVNYPLSVNYLFFNWYVPEEDLCDFFSFVYEAISGKLVHYIKDVAKEYGYGKDEGKQYI